MTLFAIRTFNFVLFPVVVAALISVLDPNINTRYRKLEIYLIYLFGLGVAGSGIGGFFGHIFISDLVAESIGWETNSPFQLEMGFANLALGVLGIMAIARRDGFREATVMAVTIIGVGATIVHIMDIIQTGNLAPGNTLQNISNLVKPVLLILLLRALRKTEKDDGSISPWGQSHAQAVGGLTAIVSTGFGLGYAFNYPLLGNLIGILIGGFAAYVLLRTSRTR